MGIKISITRMSSRGQIVIPLEVREQIKAEEGSFFAVVASGNKILLKKLDMPSETALKTELKQAHVKKKAEDEIEEYKKELSESMDYIY